MAHDGEPEHITGDLTHSRSEPDFALGRRAAASSAADNGITGAAGAEQHVRSNA